MNMRAILQESSYFWVEMYFHKFSEATRVIVSHSFGISKSFQEWIGCNSKQTGV